MEYKAGINWLSDVYEAKRQSKHSGKPILMFFHYKHCSGCANMFSRTLPVLSVVDTLTDNFVPVLIETTERPTDAQAYNVDWTPTFVVTDHMGREVDRWVGYLPEDDFLSNLDMAHAMAVLKSGEYKAAQKLLGDVMMKYPLTEQAPKALYYLGVAKFRHSNDPSYLGIVAEELSESFPDSQWTMKASVWSPYKSEKVA